MQEPVPVPEDQLPLLLPDTDNFQPSGTPESPLSVIHEWVNTVDPVGGGPARRETSTMPQVQLILTSLGHLFSSQDPAVGILFPKPYTF